MDGIEQDHVSSVRCVCLSPRQNSTTYYDQEDMDPALASLKRGKGGAIFFSFGCVLKEGWTWGS